MGTEWQQIIKYLTKPNLTNKQRCKINLDVVDDEVNPNVAL